MSGLVRISSGRLVPSVASISPSASSWPSVLLVLLFSIEIFFRSGSTVGLPCEPAVFIALCTQWIFVRSTPNSWCSMPLMKMAAVMV